MQLVEPRYTRRTVLQAVGSVALGLAGAATVQPSGVEAGRVWCRTDPNLLIDGLLANVYVSGEVDQTYDTSGPIELVITLPPVTGGEVLEADNGFGHGYNITFNYDDKLKKDHKHIHLEVAVFVPATERGKGQRVLVEFVPGNAVEVADSNDRRTNQWIKVKTRLKKQGPKTKDSKS